MQVDRYEARFSKPPLYDRRMSTDPPKEDLEREPEEESFPASLTAAWDVVAVMDERVPSASTTLKVLRGLNLKVPAPALVKL